MLEFAKFQQNAKKMFGKLTQHFMKQQGCLCFFSAIVPNNGALDDASVIGMLASSLDDSNDKHLLSYIKENTKYPVHSSKEFEDFKAKILLGIYLIKWSHYNSSVAYYLNKPLIEMFQLDLGIKSLTDMDDRMKDASLDALSHYCSYVYENRHKKSYADLNRSLGVTVQVDIHKIRNTKFAEDSSWYGVYAGILHTIGMNNMS